MNDATGELLVSVEGGVGRLRLNRPRALHALTHGMCATLAGALQAWREDAGVRLVLLDHAAVAGDAKLSRGFCAGGDVRAIWESARGDGVAARAFFHDEYQVNHLLFAYPKPIVAVMDGIVMGGGVGISQPARYRIATERTVFAMPETGIGLFPDVGGGWHLSRLPGRIGEWLALNGARLNGADCVALGLATHYIPSDALDETKARLVATPDAAAAILAAASVPPPPAPAMARRADIDRLFAGERYEDILAALEADGGAWATAQRETLAGKSPFACKVSLALVRQGRGRRDFADEMRVEYRLATRVVQRDFIEGVRALLVDKDHAPRWDPPTAREVDDDLVEAMFAALPAQDEWQPLPA
ncbi:MAG: enoyl-CoA hydratase/isomerase family protein [Sphingomonas sp.]